MKCAYDNDPRVVRNGDGYRLPDPVGGDWVISPYRGGWIATNGFGEPLLEEGDRYRTRVKVWPTAEDVLRYVIGEPQG